MKITKNESNLDRWLRAGLGVVLFLVASFWLSGWLQILFYVLAAIALITAITGFCALYGVFGFKTGKDKSDSSSVSARK